MTTNKLPEDFEYLKDMYEDEYFPKFLVDKLRDIIKECVTYIEQGNHGQQEIQKELDRIVLKTNDLQEEFEVNDSEIETVARESIGETIEKILKHFEIDIDIEEAIRERDW
ncbi:MAG: DUF5713 family protein [Bacteroidota bacterium]